MFDPGVNKVPGRTGALDADAFTRIANTTNTPHNTSVLVPPNKEQLVAWLMLINLGGRRAPKKDRYFSTNTSEGEVKNS
jgi:hypothetical protein